jgi:hypothetical protein
MNVVGLIASVLTVIDNALRDPDLIANSPQWHQLWALRKQLDDQQRELIAAQIDQGTPGYAAIATQLEQVNDQLTAAAKDIAEIDSTIQSVATISSLVTGLLKL